ncbi:MAG: DUF6259 domain-containing protein [Candidatus Omnitrophota bacterium]
MKLLWYVCLRIGVVVMFLFLAATGYGADATITFQNDSTTLGFTFKGSKVEMNSLKTTGDSQEWIANSGTGKSLCRVTIQRFDGSTMQKKIIDTAKAQNITHKETLTSNGKILTISWLGITYPHITGDLDVIGTIQLTNGSPLSSWKVQVVSRLSDWGIESVTFPRILLAADSNSEFLRPLGLGRSYPNPVQYKGGREEGVDWDSELGGSYPGCRFTMQITGLTSNNKTLYAAAHDPLAKAKDFHIQPTNDRSALQYELTHYPEAPMQAPYNWTCSYDFILGVLPGDWWHACRNYRQWVLANADWIKPPIGKAPADLPDWWVNTPLWDHSYYEACNPDSSALSYILDYHQLLSSIPTMVSYGCWNVWGFDINDPDLFPARNWFPGDLQTARAHGIEYCPYLNGLSANLGTAYWNSGGSANRVVLNQPGSQPDQNSFQTMCPQSKGWQETMRDLAGRVVKELGARAIYFDVCGGCPPQTCYATNHGHAVGNKSDFAIGIREEMRMARQQVAQARPDCIFATEDATECYGFEAPLVCNRTLSNMNTPMFMAVYADRIDPFGYITMDYEYTADPMSWRTKMAEEFIYGMQGGCMFLHKATGKADMISLVTKLAQARNAAAKYMSIGQMMHPPSLSGQNPTINTQWGSYITGYPLQAISRASVRASSWLAADGTAAIAFVNVQDYPITIGWSIASPGDSGLGNGSYTRRQVYPVENPPVDVPLRSLNDTVTVPANSPLVITINTRPRVSLTAPGK